MTSASIDFASVSSSVDIERSNDRESSVRAPKSMRASFLGCVRERDVAGSRGSATRSGLGIIGRWSREINARERLSARTPVRDADPRRRHRGSSGEHRASSRMLRLRTPTKIPGDTMNTWQSTIVASTMLVLLTKTQAADPVHLAPAAADTLRQAIEKDRTDTENWLKTAPTSYLATVLRRDFEGKESLVVGSDATSDVRIDDTAIRPHHLRVTVVGDSFHVAALDAGATFKVKDAELRDATLPPSSIMIGRYTMRLSHQQFPALIVFDPQSQRYQEYKGLHWFPVDFKYRYVLALTANPKADTVIILSTRGNQRRAVRVGWFDFKVDGKPCRLEATRLL